MLTKTPTFDELAMRVDTTVRAGVGASGEVRVQMALSPRVSIASSSLSIYPDDSFRPLTGAKNVDDDEEEDVFAEESSKEGDLRRPKSPALTGLRSFLLMSRVKQLTVISFSLSNLGVGCFFSILGPFFPNEVRGWCLPRSQLSLPPCRKGPG